MSGEQAKRTRGTARSILITPLGHAILEAVAQGKYKLAPRRGYIRPPVSLNAKRKRK